MQERRAGQGQVSDARAAVRRLPHSTLARQDQPAAPTPELQVNAEAVRTEYHRSLLLELQRLAAIAVLTDREKRRGREVLKLLRRYGIVDEGGAKNLPGAEASG